MNSSNRMIAWGAALLGVGLLGTWLAATGPTALAQEVSRASLDAKDEDCIDCHTDLDDDEKTFTFADGTALSFALDLERHRASAHGGRQACVDCHPGYDDRHRGFPEESRRAYAEKRSEMCVECHDGTVPGHTVSTAGAPTCVDCHSVHADGPVESSEAARLRRCGACHEQELARYEAGGHGPRISPEHPNLDLPACSTCHPSHRPEATPQIDPRLEATALCIECHSTATLIEKYDLPPSLTETYRDDFHGGTYHFLQSDLQALEPDDVMVCSDCHGPHEVGAVEQAALIGVCRRCHEGADEKLAGAWLGHEPVGPRHGTLVWGIRLLYYVFIPIVVGGLGVIILMHIRHRRENGKAKAPRLPPGLPETVVRFNRLERFEHQLGMVTFTLLVLTGIPQLFPGTNVGDVMLGWFGGVESTRLIHRTVGFVFVAQLVFHVCRGILWAIRYRRPSAIFLGRRDFVDAHETLMHYLGRGPMPKSGRFDFREKFEYWGLVFGGTVMSVTGLLLIFPELATRILPGSWIVAGRAVHGLEATLAVLVVVVWHLYGVILRPEIFPLDASIFTGRISTERLLEEHALEFERLFPGATRPAASPGEIPAEEPEIVEVYRDVPPPAYTADSGATPEGPS